MLDLTHFTDPQLQSAVNAGIWAGLGVAIFALLGAVVPVPSIRIGSLILTLVLGIIGFAGGLASNGLTERSNEALRKAYRVLSARTIQPNQVEALKKFVSACGTAVHVQSREISDGEVLSFKLSLENAFHDAGFNVEPIELPTLEYVGGFDITLYMPGVDLDTAQTTPLYKTLSSFGYSVGYNNAAFNVPPDMPMSVTEEAKHFEKPNYCIIYVNKRPPSYLLGPTYLGQPH